MEHYVGLDVSLKLTAICIVDRTGKIEREGAVASDPAAIAAFIKSHAPNVTRIGLETGATSTWLWTELNKMGLPVICIDARHAKAALKMQINKSDRNDAVGIARIMQCGWYKEVRVKDLDSHATKALLVSRALLVKIKRDIENQIRGLLKNLGLVVGRAKMNVFAMRAAELFARRLRLHAATAEFVIEESQVAAVVGRGQHRVDPDNRRPGPRDGLGMVRERDAELLGGRRDIDWHRAPGPACDPVGVSPSGPEGGIGDTWIETDTDVAVGRDEDRAEIEDRQVIADRLIGRHNHQSPPRPGCAAPPSAAA